MDKLRLFLSAYRLRSYPCLIAPLCAQAARGGREGMTFRSLASRIYRNGKEYVQILKSRYFPGKIDIPALTVCGPKSNCGGTEPSAATSLVRRLLGRVWEIGPAAEARKDSTKWLLYGRRKAAAPILAFVGVAMADRSGIVTKRDERDSICEEIRSSMSYVMQYSMPEIVENKVEEAAESYTYNDLETGEMISKPGCNGVVYEARWKGQQARQLEIGAGDFERAGSCSSSGSFDLIREEDMIFDISTKETPLPSSQSPMAIPPEDRFNGFPLAVKMMFNYSIESNSTSILKSMYKETVPSRTLHQTDLPVWDLGLRNSKKQLPPHPNIVDMQSVFADYVPYLPNAMRDYPEALPTRFNVDGYGRNMTLFLVMKRYDTNLQSYLKSQKPNPDVNLMILIQLLEGVTHMVHNGVAHRDLKTDNVLVDLSYGRDFPRVVITDFGCCLADSLGLKLTHNTWEVDKGGNSALMAPEVATAVPGPFSSINYEQADTWAVGALAYEIHGSPNPFYGSRGLQSRTYKEHELPVLPSDNPVVVRLVRDLLKRNPKTRITPSVAANVCHLLLWGPSIWFSARTSSPTEQQVMQWLVHVTATVVLHYRSKNAHRLARHETFKAPNDYPNLHPVVRGLVETFLNRVTLHDVMAAVDYIRDIEELEECAEEECN